VPDVGRPWRLAQRLDIGPEQLAQLGQQAIQAHALATGDVVDAAADPLGVHGEPVRLHGVVDVREVA
jgi:hypothetical protein